MNQTLPAERILLVLTSLFLFVAPFTSSAGWRAGTLVASAACAAFLAARGRLEMPRPVPRALFIALGAWCVLAVASLAWSVNPSLTAGELRGQLLYSALAFGVFYACANAQRWRTWWIVMLCGSLALLGAESLREALEPSLGLREWDGGGGAFSTHLTILAPLLLPLAWRRPEGSRLPVVLFVLSLLVLFFAAWRTENRIVWLAFLVAFGLAALAHRFAGEQRPRFNGARYVAVAGVIAIVVLATFTLQYRAPHEPGRSGPLAGLQADLRPRLWSIALDETAKAPLLGHGYGREILAPAFRLETPHNGHHPELLHAHNLFLNIAVQLGWTGVALFALILALLVREFGRALSSHETCAAGILGLAVIGGFVTKNLTDDFLYRHNGIVFWAVMGMLLGLTRARRNP